MPANAVVRPSRGLNTPRRRPTSACRIDSSAVRCAWSDVSPNVRPSTTTTSSVAAKKILAARLPRPVQLSAVLSKPQGARPPRMQDPGVAARGSRISQRLEELHQIRLLRTVEPEVQAGVVVRHDVGEGGEAAVVVVG